MTEKCLTNDFELRGRIYEIWRDDGGGNYLVDTRHHYEVDTSGFIPQLTNDELLSIYDYGKGY